MTSRWGGVSLAERVEDDLGGEDRIDGIVDREVDVVGGWGFGRPDGTGAVVVDGEVADDGEQPRTDGDGVGGGGEVPPGAGSGLLEKIFGLVPVAVEEAGRVAQKGVA